MTIFGSIFGRLGIRFRPPRRAQDGPKRPPRPPRRAQDAAKTAQEAATTAPRGSRKTGAPLHFSVLAAKSLQGPPGTPPRLIFDRFLIDFLVDFRSLLGRFLVDFCLILDSLFDRFLERLLLLFSLLTNSLPSSTNSPVISSVSRNCWKPRNDRSLEQRRSI